MGRTSWYCSRCSCREGKRERSRPYFTRVDFLYFSRRAEKFGVEYRDPSLRREFRDAARRERSSRSGFATGFDVFAEEEKAKRAQRAERFGMPDTGLEWAPPTVDEDEAKRKARAERFGGEYQPPDETGLMDVDLQQERKDPPIEAARRPDAVHVYGVDFLSTKDLLDYFADYGPTFVEWINDSAANVLFEDAPTAKRAIAGRGKPLPSEDLPEGIDPQSAIDLLWHKGDDVIKAGNAVPLIFRTATVLDVKPSERVPSRRLWLSFEGGRTRRRGGRGGGRGFGHHGRRGRRIGKGNGLQKRQNRRNEKGNTTFDSSDIEGLVQQQLEEQGKTQYPEREAVNYGDL